MSYQIRIDNELYDFLESQRSDGKTIGEAIRRMLEKYGAPVPPIKTRSLFAERRRQIYRLPILRILVEGNGEARVPEIKDKLFSRIKSQLTETEKTGIKSNRPTWWYDAEYERFEMTQDGLIDGTSPRGFWKLTRKGMVYARSPKQ